MDEGTRQQWKWKFYRIVLHLNTVIFMIGATILAAILVPEPYHMPLVAILLILDILLIFTFNRNYRATKAWLDEHGTSHQNE